MKFEEGAELGPYKLRGLLGAGAMGEVYRAWDSRLEREVAIKVVSGRGLDREALNRFTAETRAVAALSHPNIVTIHDVGEIDGLPYAVMELLEGETLRDVLASGRMPADRTLSIATQIASALAAAHARQIVHRDLKPENIFLLLNGRAKLLDFGIAKLAVPSDVTTQVATAEGLIIGTGGYMAPEQARGRAIDARVDVFAFGAVLYEMATGRRAFPGETFIDVLAATIDDRRPGFEASPDVPEAVRRVIDRCLERNPQGRFASAAELLIAVERLHGPQPSGIALPEVPPAISSIAVLPFTDMSKDRDQEYLCEGMAEEIITALSTVPGLKVASRTAAFHFRDRAADIRSVGDALHVASVLEGSVRTAAGRLRVTARLTTAADGYLRWSKTFDRDLADIFAVEDEIARAIVDLLQVTLGVATNGRMIKTSTGVTEAYTAYLKGRYYWNRRTDESLVAAIDSFRQAISADPGYARAHAGLADVYATLAIYGRRPPRDVMPEAKHLAMRALELAPDLAEAYVSLGLVEAVFDWTWSDAERHFLKAIDLAPDYATASQWYALNCLVPLGRFEEARRAIDRAVAIDPVSLPISTSVGLVAYYQDRFDEASALFRTTIALDEHFGPAHFFLGQALTEANAVTEARRHAERAVELSGRSAETLAGLGYACARAGDRERATAILDELETMACLQYVSPGVIAQVQAGLGDTAGAFSSLTAARDLRATDLAWLAVRPTFRHLHGDPAFQSLVAGLGLVGPLSTP